MRVLLIEDHPPDVVLITRHLQQAGLDVHPRHVDSREAFCHELENHPPDVILSDHGIPGFDGFAALAEARSRCPDVPFIFVTGAPEHLTEEERVRSGADDYVLKSRLHLLAPAVERAIQDARTRATHRKLQESLANAEEHLRVLLDEIQEYATFMVDGEGRVASWNARAGQLLGYEPHSILGADFAALFCIAADQPIRPAEMLLIAESSGRFEGNAVCLREGPHQFNARLVIIPLSSGGQRGFLCVLHDRSGNAPAGRSDVRPPPDSHEMEEFTYAIALDLRAPLRNIESFAGLLLKSAGDSLDPKNHAYLRSILEASHQMSRLIDDLFTFARIGQAEMHHLHLSLSDIAKEVIHDLRHETEGRDVEWRVGRLPEVIGDPVMMWIVMTNLLSNAIKFTRPRAKAVIELGAEEQPGEFVVFVKDNGVGFDMHYAPRLFRAFQRFHKDEFAGTGVGLANVRRIIERCGGRVWAEGAEDQGATFYFSLPRQTPPISAPRAGGTGHTELVEKPMNQRQNP